MKSLRALLPLNKSVVFTSRPLHCTVEKAYVHHVTSLHSKRFALRWISFTKAPMAPMHLFEG